MAGVLRALDCQGNSRTVRMHLGLHRHRNAKAQFENDLRSLRCEGGRYLGSGLFKARVQALCGVRVRRADAEAGLRGGVLENSSGTEVFGSTVPDVTPRLGELGGEGMTSKTDAEVTALGSGTGPNARPGAVRASTKLRHCTFM